MINHNFSLTHTWFRRAFEFGINEGMSKDIWSYWERENVLIVCMPERHEFCRPDVRVLWTRLGPSKVIIKSLFYLVTLSLTMRYFSYPFNLFYIFKKFIEMSYSWKAPFRLPLFLLAYDLFLSLITL